MIGTVKQVREVAVVLVVICANFEQQRVFNDGPGYDAGNSVIGTAASAIDPWAVNRSPELAGKILGRIAGVYQHCAACHIASEKNPLRTAQDLNAFQIEQVEHHAAIETQVNAVDKHADCRIDGRDRAVDAKTADREVRLAAASADLVK